jgi:hypothetical protein
VEQQVAGRDVAVAGPHQVGAEPQAGGAGEVLPRVVELHHPRDVAPALLDPLEQAEPERGVAHLVEHRGAGRQDAVLDPQVGAALRDPVARTVPAVDGPVVDPQGGEPGGAAGAQLGQRVLVQVGAEQHREAGDVLLEDLQHRRADPAPAEAHPRRLLADVGRDRQAGVDRLLEERNAGLPPEVAAEQQRRVGGAGEHRRCHRLGGVVAVDELFRADLEVDLEAGVAGLQHHVVVADEQLVAPLDAEQVLLAAQLAERLVERQVARRGDHVGERQIRLVEGRQDAGEHRLGVVPAGRLAHPLDQAENLPF